MPAQQLHQNALDRLGSEIVNGLIPPALVLTLADLEHRFGVSRTVAREIMQGLQALGLATSRRRVGITVQPKAAWKSLDPLVVGWRLSGSDRLRALLEYTELRAAVQPMAAMLAARHATKAQRERLVELAERIPAFAGHPDGPEATTLDVEFQCLLLAASANDGFASLSGVVRLVHRSPDSYQRPTRDDPRWVVRYRGIAVAIASGDEDMSRRWAHEQVRVALRAVREIAESTRPTPEDRPGVEGWSV